MKSRRRALCPEERGVRDAALVERLVAVLGEIPQEKICLYHPSDGEPDFRPLLVFFPERSFYFPVICGDEMAFFLVRADAEFVPGAFGIPEPAERTEGLGSPDGKTVVCLPGVAFDRQGGRIGRGRGFYDRFLARAGRSVLKIGTAYSFQVLPEPLPLKAGDVRMDLLVTDEYTLPCGGKA